MEATEQLSVSTLQAQLEAISQHREALKTALEHRHEAEKSELAAEIKELITDGGHVSRRSPNCCKAAPAGVRFRNRTLGSVRE
ncbi:MAG: hypothetical protein ACLFTD_12330 [Halochromatium sp.]